MGEITGASFTEGLVPAAAQGMSSLSEAINAGYNAADNMVKEMVVGSIYNKYGI